MEEYHYKQRQPIETINLIKQFFQEKEFDIRLIEDQSEIGSFYCKLKLYKNNMFIFGSAGKGITKEYALASGYAELYERFCNHTFLLNSLIVNKKIEDLHINSIKIDYNNLLLQYPFLKYYGNKMFNNDQDAIIKYFSFITNNMFIPNKFLHISDQNKQIILDNRIMFKITGSTGMCAGNSFEEAFNQGMSEIYERLCHRDFLLNPPNCLYQLSDKYLSTLNIYPQIQKLKELNYKPYIFDLGYNYSVPVILTIIINSNKMNAYYDLGAFPIIDIAIERTLTETYQGVKSYNDIAILQQQVPFRSKTIEEVLSINAASTLNCFCIDELIFDKIKIVDQPSDSFIGEQNTNHDIFIYFKYLNQIHNFNIYYQDNSLSSNITSLYLICPEILENQYNQNNDNIKLNNEYIFEILLAYQKLINNCISNNLDNCLIEILNIITKNNKNYSYRISSLLYGDSLNFYPTAINNKIFLDLISLIQNYTNLSQLFDIFNTDATEIYQKQLVKFVFIQNYLQAKYSPLEIFDLNKIFNNNLSLNDINNIQNPKYLLQNIFLNPFLDYYNNIDYDNIILLFYE